MKTNKRIPMSCGIYSLRTIITELALEFFCYPEDTDFYEDNSLIKIAIKEKLSGEGSTCVVYKGAVISGKEEIRQIIVKEFYPYSKQPYPEISKREAGKLIFDAALENDPDFLNRKKQYLDSFIKQRELSNIEELMDAVSRPECLAVIPGGCGLYIISDAHFGDVLDVNVSRTFFEKLEMIKLISNTFMAIEKHDYVLLDISPDNLLYINQPFLRQIMLFDLDSLVNENDIDKIDREMLRFHARYKAPQLSELERRPWNFDDQKYVYIDKSLNSHILAILSYELLFAELPNKSFYSLRNAVEDSLVEKLADLYNISDELAKDIVIFIHSMLSVIEINRPCRDCDGFAKAVDGFILKLNDELKQRTIRDDYCRYVAYSMLDKYPLCDHISVDGSGQKRMEISIIGQHVLREFIFKAVFSICQLYDTKLVINVISEDAFKWWDKLSSDNPALLQTVILYKNGGIVSDGFDKAVVSRALADIRLYDDLESFIDLNVIENSLPKYYICMEDKGDSISSDKYNTHIMNRLYDILRKSSQDCKILYALNHINDGAVSDETVGYINLRELYSDFTERLYRTEILKKGLKVHERYCRMYDPAADDIKIREDYFSDTYKAWTSVRLAMSSVYRNRDYNDGVDIDRLSAVEHLAWTAYMVSNGAVPPKDGEEISRYAYYGKNDWKDITDAAHIVHPCIAAGGEARPLKNIDWDNISVNIEDLDNLDRNSIEVYRITKQRAMDNLPVICNYVQVLKYLCLSLNDPDVKLGVTDLVKQIEDKISNIMENGSEIKRLLDETEQSLDKSGAAGRQPVQVILDIKNLLRPVLDLNREHDFKKSDVELVAMICS